MITLYSVEQDKNRWDYGNDVGLIPKQNSGSDYDAIQDQNIESNKSQIQETKQSLEENNERDNAQQSQLDANDALDVKQQTQIDSNTEAIQRNESRDNAQQSQIDETIERLNQNISEDQRQQQEINANKTEISRLDSEIPTLSIEGTALVVSKKSNNNG